jgi:hypothetical protein
MASRVTSSTIFSAAWQNVYDLVNARANIADPSGQTTRKFVYGREPDVKSAGFLGFPYIIVHGVSSTFKGTTVDMKGSEVSFTCVVEVVTSDRGFGASDGQGLTQLDAISDDLVETFNKVSNRKTLSNNNLSFSRPDTSDVVAEPLHNTLTFRRSFFLNFKARMQVSA